MSWLTALFTDTQSPAHAALIYSLVIAAGMALGRIRIRGVSLGVTFVLFTGLVFYVKRFKRWNCVCFS